jgi:hypothetical protein
MVSWKFGRAGQAVFIIMLGGKETKNGIFLLRYFPVFGQETSLFFTFTFY